MGKIIWPMCVHYEIPKVWNPKKYKGRGIGLVVPAINSFNNTMCFVSKLSSFIFCFFEQELEEALCDSIKSNSNIPLAYFYIH